MSIHPTAIITEGAQIHPEAEIGPYSVIGPKVKIGKGTTLGAHVVVSGDTTIGENCRIYAGVCIGLEPQDLKYKDEPTGVIIGNNVTLREYVTVHRATAEGYTVIGDDCFLMNYCHVAHNCKLGKGVIMANNSTLAGYVEVGDHTVFSAVCIIHQFVRIGRAVMIGGMTGTRIDLPPFTICDGRPAYVRGINRVGLRRNSVNADTRNAIKAAYKLMYRSGLNNTQACERIEAEIEQYDEIKEIVAFFRQTKRGVAVAMHEVTETASLMEEVPMEPV